MTEAELETQVLNSLDSLLNRYQQINSLADQMLAPDQSVESLNEKTIQLKMDRESIERLEIESRPSKEQYRATRDHASPAVKQKTDQLASVMQQFLMKISKLEREARSSCDNLLPQIHNGVRAVQMKNAYAKYK